MSAGVAGTENRPLPKDVAARAALLSLRAKAAADALLAGHHRSLRHGASAVFVEHREYRPGDDPRRLDWRAFARTDRPIIRHFEHEAQLRATLLFDRSRSMYFADPGGPRLQGTAQAATPSKAEHAATLLGAIAYLLMRQGDAFGLMYVDQGTEVTFPPRARLDHFDSVLSSLANHERAPTDGGEMRGTDLLASLRSAAERTHRHGVVVLASDLLDPEALTPDATERPAWSGPLGLMARRGQTVLVLHVLTRSELELSGTEPARYVGLEGEPATEADPVDVRRRYQARVARFCARAERAVTTAGGRYTLACTDEDPTLALARLLTPSARGGR